MIVQGNAAPTPSGAITMRNMMAPIICCINAITYKMNPDKDHNFRVIDERQIITASIQVLHNTILLPVQ